MNNNGNGEENLKGGVRAKIRLDFKGIGKPGRLFFGGRNTEKAAEEVRDQQVAMFRNVPIQGISIEDIDMSIEVYTVYDDINHTEIAYAPVEIMVAADTLQDLLRFVVREDFRKVEILEPAQVQLSNYEIERLLFRFSEEMKDYREYLERKYNR
ncbi:hypothetical protein JOC37_001045 [Desulfohalotomaculum tongense]|uniref:hypothetical protein n=1 Tax=Desulforadius tongensis TaxID=1216062 RepID=UPI00195BDCFA|nr:hypothetical protein [Desulforadius tongensis]MBM7854667.1 hypothetical protein [Desulforadius tongensis]